MKAFFITFFSLVMLTAAPIYAAGTDGSTKTCDEGQYYNSESYKCADCPGGDGKNANSRGHYCPGGTTDKQQCPPSYPASANGAKSQNECYIECKQETITNGKKVPIPGEDKAYFNNSCKFNIECNNATDKCNGYHSNGDECISNKKTCTNLHRNAKDGFQLWEGNGWSTCYIQECNDGYNLVSSDSKPLDRKCNTTVGTQCESNACSAVSDVADECDGEIDGTWSFDGSTKNYENCICHITVQANNGTFTDECYYNTDEGTSEKWTNCRRTGVVSCDTGYCQSSDAPTCDQVQQGYFSGTNDKQCHECPMGSTSIKGASKITDCHITNETQFCDNDGCFTLPLGKNKIPLNSYTPK